MWLTSSIWVSAKLSYNRTASYVWCMLMYMHVSGVYFANCDRAGVIINIFELLCQRRQNTHQSIVYDKACWLGKPYSDTSQHNYLHREEYVTSKKLDFKTQGTTWFITLSPLVAPSLCSGATAQGLRVINSIDPCVLKSNYCFKNIFLYLGQRLCL